MQRIRCGISLLVMSIRYSLLASRENRWAAGVCTEEGSELYVLGPQMTHGEASSECISSVHAGLRPMLLLQ